MSSQSSGAEAGKDAALQWFLGLPLLTLLFLPSGKMATTSLGRGPSSLATLGNGAAQALQLSRDLRLCFTGPLGEVT